ncbi:condensin complex component, non-smc subunit [Reticulomyxa filosa]|uniref:Condensin complex component, non-smc subunit n=1 Tax=Reticulomyxa filosa TaxID=46433 RepID=X6P3P6_RETFI|nr:condensin complex component, non-smc subunit [Reticulomyxa filosa]|eukprot:ETO32197.1 condensin complex component, non-smc subunit [Reticulomyxa filosa]
MLYNFKTYLTTALKRLSTGSCSFKKKIKIRISLKKKREVGPEDGYKGGSRGRNIKNEIRKYISKSKLKKEGVIVRVFFNEKKQLDLVLLRFHKETPVERVVQFVISVATFQGNGGEWADMVIHELLGYLLTKENAKEKAVRFRVCDIMAKLLRPLSEDNELEF